MILSGSFSGHFEMNVYDAQTHKLVHHREFDNMITDIGLRSYCGSGEVVYGPPNRAHIAVGKGTNAPSPLDTELGNHFATSDGTLAYNGALNGGAIAGVAPDWVWGTKGTARFNAGRFNGDSITEVGVAGINGKLWSRALILDEHGQPSSITILSNEYLDVTYTLYYHPLLTDTSFTFDMGGVTYSCVARDAIVNVSPFASFPFLSQAIGILALYSSQTLGEVTGTISTADGVHNYPDGIGIPLAYNSQKPYTVSTSNFISTPVGNFQDGIGGILVGNNSNYLIGGVGSYTQISFQPKLPKDANTEITLTIEKSISRYVAPTP